MITMIKSDRIVVMNVTSLQRFPAGARYVQSKSVLA